MSTEELLSAFDVGGRTAAEHIGTEALLFQTGYLTITDYAAKYRGRGEPVHLIGVEFSRKTRNVTAFVGAGLRAFSQLRSFGFFRLDDLDPVLPQLLSSPAVDRRRGQNDARRAHSRGLLVQTTLAFQARLDRGPDAGSDLDKDMLVIMDQDVELLAGDGALLDGDSEGLFQHRGHGPSKDALIADPPGRSQSIKRPLKLVEPAGHLSAKLPRLLFRLFEALIGLFEALVHLSAKLLHLPFRPVEALVDLLEALVHVGTERSQFGEHQRHLFAASERLQERREDGRLKVRASFQQVRQATAEHLDQVFVAYR